MRASNRAAAHTSSAAARASVAALRRPSVDVSSEERAAVKQLGPRPSIGTEGTSSSRYCASHCRDRAFIASCGALLLHTVPPVATVIRMYCYACLFPQGMLTALVAQEQTPGQMAHNVRTHTRLLPVCMKVGVTGLGNPHQAQRAPCGSCRECTTPSPG